MTNFDVLLDGIFGFSFSPKGGIRDPFKDILEAMTEASISEKEKLKIVSIDIPSGWDVEAGNTGNVLVRCS